MEFGERLRVARANKGWSQVELADKSGVSQATISKIERGDQEQSVHTPVLASTLGISALWLATGIDDTVVQRGRERLGAMLENAAIAAGAIAEPATAYNSQNVEPGPDIFGKVPLISHIQAGNWCEAVDNFHPGDAEEWLPAPTRHGPHAYALRVVGSSMEPRFREGEIVVVDPEVTATSGRFVVAKKVGTQEVTLKQLVIEAGDSYLKALNPHWPEPIIRMTEEWLVCGSVICKIEIF